MNREINIANVNNFSYIRGSSLGLAKYMKFSKGLGVIGPAVTTGISAINVFNQAKVGGLKEMFNHRDILDAGVGVLGLGATGLAVVGLISNPVGWGIGIGVLVYGAGTLIYDAYNDNK